MLVCVSTKRDERSKSAQLKLKVQRRSHRASIMADPARNTVLSCAQNTIRLRSCVRRRLKVKAQHRVN